MKIRNFFLLVLTALIWGSSFVAQKSGGPEVGAFTFNGIRSFIGGVFLIVFILLRDKCSKQSKTPATKEEKRNLWIGGTLCGVVLFVATSLQQVGMNLGASAGTAGFLTACYMVLVPILGLFLKKKCPWHTWISVFVALVGLYLLCINGSLALNLYDGIVLLCALVFAIHILVIDRFAPLVDGVRLSCIQFLVCGVLSIVPMWIFDLGLSFEHLSSWLSVLSSFTVWIPILYAGIMSCGVAYTLQIVAQKGMNPTIASMILSLESVFSVLSGWLILGERMTFRNILGCALIFAAILFVQLPVGKKKEAQ
ncbi:MAG: DMT family transporter [Clostridia bacterium]|nr:DMT family transporter [Clostridia bacterium]